LLSPSVRVTSIVRSVVSPSLTMLEETWSGRLRISIMTRMSSVNETEPADEGGSGNTSAATTATEEEEEEEEEEEGWPTSDEDSDDAVSRDLVRLATTGSHMRSWIPYCSSGRYHNSSHTSSVAPRAMRMRMVLV